MTSFEFLGGRNRLCRGQRQNRIKVGKIQTILRFKHPSCHLTLVFSNNSICPRHPELLREVTKRLTAYQRHGNHTPGRFSTGCPHWLRRFYHARPVTEQEYHCPYCLSSPYREPPDIGSRLFIAPYRAVCSANRGAVANVAYVHHNSNRNVFDEWVFNCQRMPRSQ